MSMIGSLMRFGRRQLQTIISREIIKPSSRTPSHLKTYNLSLLDQISMNAFVPMVTFYENNTSIYRSSHDKTLDLKKSLWQTLSKYYPFAGRHAKNAPAYVDCSDDGAEFLEALIDCTLSVFLEKSEHEDMDQLFPDGRLWFKSNRRVESEDEVIPLAVQVNHFECGGVAVTLSLSHKIADGSSTAHFLNDWAKMTRFCSTEEKLVDGNPILDPEFIPFPNININFNGFSINRSNDCATKSFMFHNSKLNDLKLKVTDMTTKSGQPITNPTRVEVLNWLLYKCAVAAASQNNSGCFKPTGISHPTNIRGKMIEPLSEKTIGNIFIVLQILTDNESEMNPASFISELKKQKMRFKGLRNIETTFSLLSSMSSKSAIDEQQTIVDKTYICTGMCGLPAYEIDFGWGKPVKSTIVGNIRNSFILMDAPNQDGIEAHVCLGKEDMAIFQSDPELLAFC